MVNKIVIKGNTKDFLERYGIDTCYTNGKEIHLEYCRNFFEGPNKKDVNKIDNSNIILIDDDQQNIRIAINNNHFAFHVNNSTKLIDLNNYLNNCLDNLN